MPDTLEVATEGLYMSHLAPTPRKEDAETRRNKSHWTGFLRRLAFWKASEEEKMDRLFTESVNDLHPEWEKRRLERKAARR
jgi:hypothetical protein